MRIVRIENVGSLELHVIGDYEDERYFGTDAPYDFYLVTLDNKLLKGEPFFEEPTRAEVIAIAAANDLEEAQAEMKANGWQLCGVRKCTRIAHFEVILYDVYTDIGDVFFKQDEICPYICRDHMTENEEKASGVREPRGHIHYPFTNEYSAQGFTIYRPLDIAL